MVNFNAITIGLEVEFLVEDNICSGIVRYKGPLNGKEGDWIGVESSAPVGYCDGRLMGRTYFTCQENHGLFLVADDLRLKNHFKKKRKNTLYKSCTNSDCDDLLFKKTVPVEKINCITEDYLRRAKSSFQIEYSDIYSAPIRYCTRESLIFEPKKEVKKSITESVQKEFHPTSTIPREFMPTDELKLYTKLNWSYKNTKLPNNSSLNNTFDGFNKSRKNYL